MDKRKILVLLLALNVLTFSAREAIAAISSTGYLIVANYFGKLYPNQTDFLAFYGGTCSDAQSGRCGLNVMRSTTAENGADWVNMQWDGLSAYVVTSVASGRNGHLRIGTLQTTGGLSDLFLMTGFTDRWKVGNTSGHLTAVADNTYDIGASGATRPRTAYLGTSVVAPTVNATTAYQLNGAALTTITMKSGSGAGDYTTTSATYADVDGTNLAYTVTVPTGFKVLASVTVSLKNSSLGAAVGVALADGTTALTEAMIDAAVASDREAVSLTYAFTGDGASHTFKLRWKTSAGTNTMDNSSSTLAPRMTFFMTPSS